MTGLRTPFPLALLAAGLVLCADVPHAGDGDPLEEALRSGALRRADSILHERLAAEPAAGGRRAELLLSLARVAVNLGEYRRGVEAATEALRIYAGLGDRAGLAQAHLRAGAAFDELGEYEDSQRHLHRALEQFRELGDRMGEATVRSAFGTSYRFGGDLEASLRFHRQAQGIFARLGQLPSLGFEHRNLGVVLEELDRTEEAEAEYRRSLELLDAWDRGWARADVSFHLGRLLARTGRVEPAAGLLDEALALARGSANRWAEARIALERARLLAEEGRLDAAVALAAEGVGILERMGAQDLEWEARATLAELLERSGDVGGARGEFERALALVESVRSSIGLPAARSRYAPRVRPVYDGALRLRRLQAGDDPDRARALFDLAERTRARSFVEMLAESRVAPELSDSPLRLEEKNLRAKISSLRMHLTRFAHTVVDRAVLEEELFQAERDHDALLLRVRREDPRYESFVHPRPMTAAETQRMLDAGADLVAYHLADGGSLAWHLSADAITLVDLPGRAQIEDLVLFFRSLVLHRNDGDSTHVVAARLHDLLLGAITPRLSAGRPLLIIPDGTLFHLPFEALELPAAPGRDGGEPLIARHPVFYAHSVSVLRELRERVRSGGGGDALDLIAFGDPSGTAEPRLVHAAAETRGIARSASRRVVRTGPAATESAFRQWIGEPSRVVHVATHGLFDGARPERSGLVFAPEDGVDDGFLGLAEIYGLRVAAELVVLAGCETARGELLRGEGVVGVTRGFLHAGSGAVVASLWKVDDRSTERLMQAFYRHLAGGLPVAEALRAAKLERIAIEPDPFLWAGFVAVGDGALEIPLRPPRRRGTGMFVAGLALLAGALVSRWWAGRRAAPLGSSTE